MTPDALAALYATAFPASRAWSADEFATLLGQKGAFLVAPGPASPISPTGFAPTGFAPTGFALGRVIIDEAELITLAVAPAAQRQGLGRKLLQRFETKAAQHGATRALLEVAADNVPARALYKAAKWRESARRADYYTRADGQTCDALILEKPLTSRK